MSVVTRALESLRSLKSSPAFTKLYSWHQGNMQYRKEGLFLDDLIPTETEFVQTALARLPPNVQEARLFRIRRALNLSVKQAELPPNEHTKPEEDVRYLVPILQQLEAEVLTRDNYLSMSKIPAALLARNRST
ncbi:cytochrome b-c1 complex subunit 7 [Globomyces pollinis-pini]|nr:cytochrome b-c1 complex subunit 7 [Globomyces pollinis-pini]